MLGSPPPPPPALNVVVFQNIFLAIVVDSFVDVKSEAKRENTVPGDLWSLSRMLSFELWTGTAQKLGLSPPRPSLREYARVMKESLNPHSHHRHQTPTSLDEMDEGTRTQFAESRKIAGILDGDTHDCVVDTLVFVCALARVV